MEDKLLLNLLSLGTVWMQGELVEPSQEEKLSNSGLSPFASPELYQSAYGTVLALKICRSWQTGYESTTEAYTPALTSVTQRADIRMYS